MKFNEYRGLTELPASFVAIFERQVNESLYLTHYWFENLIETSLDEGDDIRVFAVEHEPGDCVLMLIVRTPAGQNGSAYSGWNLGQRSLASLTNFQSAYYAPLAADISDQDLRLACQTLAQGMVNAADPWHIIDLNLLDPSCRVTAELARAFKAQGLYQHRYLYKGNWYEHLQFENFAEYLASRSKSARKSIQNYLRKRRKLANDARIEVRMLTSDDGVEEILEAYRTVYDASWKEPDPYPDYLNGLIRKSVDNRSLRFCLVILDGKAAAIELAIVSGKDAVMIRTAYDAEHQKLSLGAIAILSMVEHLIDVDHVRSIDFGTDDDPYKATWTQSRRERWGITFIRPNSSEGLKLLVRIAWQRFDTWIRSTVKTVLERASLR